MTVRIAHAPADLEKDLRPRHPVMLRPTPTSHRFRRMRVLALLLGAAALTGGCAEEITLEERPPEVLLREQVGAARLAGALPKRTATEPPAGARRFFDRLKDADDWLDNAAAWDDGVPAWWAPEVQASLGPRLAPLGTFYDEMSSLLIHPDQRAALEQGRSLAYRTSIRSGVFTYDEFATPSLERVGRWVNLLCARAIHAGQRNGDSAVVIQSLANALDLLALLNDRSTTGGAVCFSLESNVLHALRIIALGPRIDPVEMRRVMEPRLANIGNAGRMWDYLADAVGRRIEITEVLLDAGARQDADRWLAELNCSRARLAERGLDLMYVYNELTTASTTCTRLNLFGTKHPFQQLIDGMTALHELSLGSFLARWALAVNEHRLVADDWPRYLSDLDETFLNGTPPFLVCNGQKRLTYKRAFNEVRLALVGRLRNSAKVDDPLYDWSWDKNLIHDFDDHSR